MIVKTRKNVLIITDSSEGTISIASEIAKALSGKKVSIKNKKASDFIGSDLLPADVFFLGCEKPKPDSFEYLADVLKHINLVGRPCGVFSSGTEKSIKYLTGLLKDCEAALNPTAVVSGAAANIENWTQSVILHSF